MNFLTKSAFMLKKPLAIAADPHCSAAVSRLLGNYFKVTDLNDRVPNSAAVLHWDVLLLSFGNKDLKFFFENSKKPIAVINKITPEILPNKEELEKALSFLPEKACLILNYDSQEARSFKKNAKSRVLTFGFNEEADVRATDIIFPQNLVSTDALEKISDKSFFLSFKLNYRGSFVPVRIELPAEIMSENKLKKDSEELGKEEVRCALAASSVGIALGLNLVEVSQAF